MKKYYCIIVIGDNSNTETILNKVINGKFHNLNLNKIFVSTFESDNSIWEIEEILHKNKKSFFLTKMDGDNFTATIQDAKIQNDLFMDYVQKMIKFNNDQINIDEHQEFDIPLPEDLPPPDFFNYESETFNIENELNEIKKKFSKRKPVEVELSLDELLDKISAVGYDKLSDFDKNTLKKYSQTK